MRLAPSLASCLLPALALVIATPAARTQGQAGAATGQTQQSPPRHDLIKIKIRDARDLDVMRSLHLDLTSCCPPREPVREVEAFADDRDLERIRKAGLAYEIAIHNYEETIGRRLSQYQFPQDLTPPVGQGAMGGHYTFAQIVAILDKLAKDHPAICSAKTSLGKSVENRDIWMVKISDNVRTDENEPEVLYDALHHAREPMSATTTLAFMDWLLTSYGKDADATYLVNNRELYFVPCVNPDGYEYNYSVAPNGGGTWRKNRGRVNSFPQGIDLNRNWPTGWSAPNGGNSTQPFTDTYRGPSPLSEPETQALDNFIKSRNFVVACSCHTHGELLPYPWGYQSGPPSNAAHYEILSKALTSENWMRTGPLFNLLYPVAGASIDHYHATYGIYAFGPELGTSLEGFWPTPPQQIEIVKRHLPTFREFARRAGALIEMDSWRVAEGPGSNNNGIVDPGETGYVRMTLANGGASAPLTSAVATLRSLTAGVTLTRNGHDFGRVAKFALASNDSMPFVFTVAQSFKELWFQVELTIVHDNTTTKRVFDLPLGRVRELSSPDAGSGSVVARLGDVNGDGYADFSVASPYADKGQTDTGVAAVWSGKDHAWIATFLGNAGWKLGASVAGGDVDGDGKGDVVIGIPGYQPTAGAVAVMRGGTKSASVWLTGPTFFGARVASGADLDGDGYDEILVATESAYYSNLYAYSGRTRQPLWQHLNLSPIHAMDIVGDINRDGRADVIVGMPSYNGDRGRIEIRSGKDGALLRAFDGQTVESLGTTVAGVGDLDGDDVEDYMFGSPNHGGNTGNCGIQSGRTGSWIHILWGSTRLHRFGSCVSGAGGDVDRDGTPDLVVASLPVVGHGYVQVFSGKTAKLLRTVVGGSPTFGTAVAGLDTNGDSEPDLLVGEPGTTNGAAWVFDSLPMPSPPAFWRYGATCADSAARLPQIGLRGELPRLGSNYTVTLRGAPPSSVALLGIGAQKLSFDLSLIGMPSGCVWHVDPIFLLTLPTDAGGHAHITLPPSTTIGREYLFQWLPVDLQLTVPLPIVASAGAVVKFGPPR